MSTEAVKKRIPTKNVFPGKFALNGAASRVSFYEWFRSDDSTRSSNFGVINFEKIRVKEGNHLWARALRL